MAALAGDVWEFRGANGKADSGGGFSWKSLVNSTYKWTLSGSGTAEYHVELSGSGDPSLTEAKSVYLDGKHNLATEGSALGSLTVGQWKWGNNDTLGYDTLYVRLADDTDPDTHPVDYVGDGGGGGQDYSQQDAAQLQLTDLVTSGIGVKVLTSVTGGFTALMVDNYIHIRSGTNVTAGWYRITVHTDTNTVTLEDAPDDGVGGISGGSGDLGGAIDILTDFFIDSGGVVIAGNTIYVNSETMTLTGSIGAATGGTALLSITVEGYKTTRGDDPVGANRPLIICGANGFAFGSHWHFENFIITITTTTGLVGLNSLHVHNCKITNTSVSANRRCIRSDAVYGLIITCDLENTNGEGVAVDQGQVLVIACYFHDSDSGVGHSGEHRVCVINCVFDTCTAGVKGGNGLVYNQIVGNTFYNCTTGILEGTTNFGTYCFNNIFDACTTGISFGDACDNNFIDYNCYDTTTDVVGTRRGKGPNSITGDPGLTDPANGDFTLGDGSNCLNAGADVNDLTGATA